MELKDTVDLMLSGDYKERFIAEYEQLKYRVNRLDKICAQIEAGEIRMSAASFKNDTPVWMLRNQLDAMKNYLHILEVRSFIEDVNIF